MQAQPYQVGAVLEHDAYWSLRKTMALDACKWDTQVGDVATLAPFPLVLDQEAWTTLQADAEQLAQETAAAAHELAERRDLHKQLGLPRRLRNALAGAQLTPALGWVLRFDFHFTTEGWRISEVNADVPGGFTEATHLPRCWTKLDDSLQALGSPGDAWADAIAARVDRDQAIALLSATGYLEDTQIVAYLARALAKRGLRARCMTPQQLRWQDGRALHHDAIVRFYQAEWLSALKENSGWRYLFTGGATPVANPPLAPLVESKRFALTWDELTTPLPTWRRLLPSTRDPRDAPWRTDEAWLLKGAYSNTGDEVAVRALLPKDRWGKFALHARLQPRDWIAQRRFTPVPLSTPLGELYVCLGVYTVDGRAAGVYGRASRTPIIDYASFDVAVMRRW